MYKHFGNKGTDIFLWEFQGGADNLYIRYFYVRYCYRESIDEYNMEYESILEY